MSLAAHILSGLGHSPPVILPSDDPEDIAGQRLQLIDCGWRPVPASPKDKSCHVVGWPTIEPSEFHVANWTHTHSVHTLTALVSGQRIFAIDIDVLDPERSQLVQQVAFRLLGVTPFIRIGRAPKSLLVYRQPWPATTPIRSESFHFADGVGAFEILSVGKQFVAYGIHPDTAMPYRWIGDASPLEDSPNDAPLVTQTQVDQFIQVVRELADFAVGLNGKPTDAPRLYNAQGLAADGRENLLRDCVFKAAHEINRKGGTLEPRAVAGRAWELFTERAVTTDSKWTYQDALAKASSTVRRVRDGRVSLEDAGLTIGAQFFRSLGNELERVRGLFVRALSKVKWKLMHVD